MPAGISGARLLLAGFAALAAVPAAAQTPPLSVSANHRYLEAGGKPFFWMGDTAWLLLSRLNREEAEHYLATRQRQGFNVIQVMVLHTSRMTNRYDAPALVDGDPGRPRTTPGNPRRTRHQSWPGARRRRVSQPSIHLPRSV